MLFDYECTNYGCSQNGLLQECLVSSETESVRCTFCHCPMHRQETYSTHFQLKGHDWPGKNIKGAKDE